MVQPNLFSYATSELSQDAFICWLLSWASPEHMSSNKALYQCAVDLIQAMFEKHTKKPPLQIKKIEVSKQDSNIDVLCIINGKYAILIEDKTDTINHSNQLVRYLEELKNRVYKEEDILPIYFKTEDQGDYTDVENKGYKPFLRPDILNTLNSYAGNNSIVLDYRNHLQSISDQVESYKNLPIEEWGWRSWVGFYQRLKMELGKGNWNYVPNQQGGFLGFWWHEQGDEHCEQYLQLEEDKLCFKIGVNNPSEQSRLRTKWHKIIRTKSLEPEYELNLSKPPRFGKGACMTVCIYDGEYRECSDNHIVDIDKTVQKLKIAEALLDAVRKSI